MNSRIQHKIKLSSINAFQCNLQNWIAKRVADVLVSVAFSSHNIGNFCNSSVAGVFEFQFAGFCDANKTICDERFGFVNAPSTPRHKLNKSPAIHQCSIPRLVPTGLPSILYYKGVTKAMDEPARFHYPRSHAAVIISHLPLSDCICDTFPLRRISPAMAKQKVEFRVCRA